MRDHASEKKPSVGVGQILGFKRNVGEEVPSMVERHNDHDQAAQHIDRYQARALYREVRPGGLDRRDSSRSGSCNQRESPANDCSSLACMGELLNKQVRHTLRGWPPS